MEGVAGSSRTNTFLYFPRGCRSISSVADQAMSPRLAEMGTAAADYIFSQFFRSKHSHINLPAKRMVSEHMDGFRLRQTAETGDDPEVQFRHRKHGKKAVYPVELT